MKDNNGNPIEVQGDFVIVRVSVRSTVKAALHSNGRIRTLTDQYYESAKQADSWTRKNDPGVQFGLDEVNGESSVVIDLKQIRALAFAAARNKSKKAQQGPSRAAFSGIRTFTKESA